MTADDRHGPRSDADAIRALADQLAAGVGTLRDAATRPERPAHPAPGVRRGARGAAGPRSFPDPETRPKAAALARARAEAAAAAPAAKPSPAEARPRRTAAEQLRLRTGALGFATGVLTGALLAALGLWSLGVLSPAAEAPVLEGLPAPTVEAEAPVADHRVVETPPAVAAAPPPVPETPPAVAAAPPPVLVSVNASPWAEIRIDGRSVGETPIADLAVPPGRYEVEASLPDGRVLRRNVALEGAHAHIVFP